MKIGETIRSFRTRQGLSQGDIEKRTGLLRCYLSRVENGHTVPSLETLAKIAGALEMPLAHFFTEEAAPQQTSLGQISDDELRFLTQIRRYAATMSDADKEQLLGMVRKLAGAQTGTMSAVRNQAGL